MATDVPRDAFIGVFVIACAAGWNAHAANNGTTATAGIAL
jgi:citrate synthase